MSCKSGRVLAAGVCRRMLAARQHGCWPPKKAAKDKADDPLPLTKVVLFNSGVGFFQHAGEIEGDRRIELKFNVDDINDLLKSMVVQVRPDRDRDLRLERSDHQNADHVRHRPDQQSQPGRSAGPDPRRKDRDRIAAEN